MLALSKYRKRRHLRAMPGCAVVTGACEERGVGAAIASKILESGVTRVVLAARCTKKLEGVARGLRKQFPAAHVGVIVYDPMWAADRDTLAVRVSSLDLGGGTAGLFSGNDITLLVHNAGTEANPFEAGAAGAGAGAGAVGGADVTDFKHSPASTSINSSPPQTVTAFEEISKASIDQQLGIQLSGAIHLTRAVLPSMLSRRYGSIVFVSSVAGTEPVPHHAVHAAAAAGRRGFAASLRQECWSRGVTVHTVSHGLVQVSEHTESATATATATAAPLPPLGHAAQQSTTQQTQQHHQRRHQHPSMVGSTKPEAVARAVVDVVELNKQEEMVSSVPLRPLLLLTMLQLRTWDCAFAWF